jgi:hypothetical protein
MRVFESVTTVLTSDERDQDSLTAWAGLSSFFVLITLPLRLNLVHGHLAEKEDESLV